MSIGHCGGYIVKTGSLKVLQVYEVGRNSDGAQGSPRNRLGPLTVIRAADCAC